MAARPDVSDREPLLHDTDRARHLRAGLGIAGALAGTVLALALIPEDPFPAGRLRGAAAALAAGAAVLLSEDMQHGQVIDGLCIENPFRADEH